MNDAFEGKKTDWRDQYNQKTIKVTHDINTSKAETLVSNATKKAAGKPPASKQKNENLDPIMEEN
jgi:hypothetical protein